jgi:hypothetical protein
MSVPTCGPAAECNPALQNCLGSQPYLERTSALLATILDQLNGPQGAFQDFYMPPGSSAASAPHVRPRAETAEDRESFLKR